MRLLQKVVVGHLRVMLGTCKLRCTQYILPGAKKLDVGGQRLTCAISRSGIRGLDLFLTTSPGFGLLGLGGGGRLGSVMSASGAGSVGEGPSRADGSGAGAATASLSLCFMVLTDLVKQS
jgi:hypothetical protein